MGMFDYYKPAPNLMCPYCGTVVGEWQGKGGPCILATYREGGSTTPDGHGCMPADFRIYGTCERDHWVEATGHCVNGFWQGTEIDMDETERAHERHEQAKAARAQFLDQIFEGS